jgi:hypothetical protein
MDGTEAHRQALQQQHAGLEKLIAAEMKRRLPDPIIVATLKKRKLRIKEELTHMLEPG